MKFFIVAVVIALFSVCCMEKEIQKSNGIPHEPQTQKIQESGTNSQSTPDIMNDGGEDIHEDPDKMETLLNLTRIPIDESVSDEEFGVKPGMEDGATQVTEPELEGKDVGKGGAVERPNNPERDECLRECDDYCVGQLNGCQIDCMTEYNAKRNEVEKWLESCKDSCGGWTNLWGLLGKPYKCYNSCNEYYNSLVNGYEEQYTSCRDDCASQFGDICRKECYGTC